MAQRQSVALRVEIEDGYTLFAEVVFALFPEHIQLDDAISLEDMDPTVFGDGEAGPAIVANESILGRLSMLERGRLEDDAERLAFGRSWQDAIWGKR